jgi:hypothetical protein
MQKLNRMLIAIGVTLTTAFASAGQLSSEAYSQGWRRAKVLAIGKDELAVRSAKGDCRKAVGTQTEYARFAVVSYSYGGNPNLRKKRIVAIPNDGEVKVGDWASVSITDCRLALKYDAHARKGP